ncbi:MAG TPA: deoxyribodipyrimidine photo-lyase, partial [Candidatus Acidoferrum sp.]|nr:deoxyribodipyrimidine photo-lyase [Candidatus Acidoferrum sp.]
MSRRYRKALMIFRRDLRLEDNTALREATCLSDSVVPAFIFDPRQIEQNPLRNDFALQFMADSLTALDLQ